MSIEKIMTLLKCVASTNYFVFDGQIYLQKEDFAMGYPPSPPLADIFMIGFEEQALSSFPHPLAFGCTTWTTHLSL